MSEKNICRACNNPNSNNTILIKEMMNSTKEEFKYYECTKCGSLTISEVPKNLGEYYNNYYSFQNYNPILKLILKYNHKDYFSKNIIGFLSKILVTEDDLWKLLSKLYKSQKINLNSKILDVGCGIGIFLNELYELGFNNLEGIDPFLENEIHEKGYIIHNNFITDYNFNKKYDIIFMKDSLEHMDNPLETINILQNILEKDGLLIITIPIKSTTIWKYYGVNWFQLDAPRHLTTFTLKGFKKFIEQTDLKIKEVIFNSNEMGFLISEDYKNGKGINSPNAFHKIFLTNNIFLRIYNRKFKKFNLSCCETEFTLTKLKNYIKELNDNNEGEHAIFIIKK